MRGTFQFLVEWLVGAFGVADPVALRQFIDDPNMINALMAWLATFIENASIIDLFPRLSFDKVIVGNVLSLNPGLCLL
ncbi:hypothetical protein I5O09_22100 [Pseudomonas parafulva]|uniref:hypothetical protein n=1 Tax=Pseudomonas parafulva TaxID=157782 RepID=UPI0018D705ED|nr:hypothetical protein [Pseudomonas parafulva]MBH3346419.1 hypothetical protein [Pseudomonas parafulva]